MPFRLTLYLSFCTTIQHSIKTYHCSQCGSEDIVKNGADYKGDQKYYCHHCHACGTLEPQGHSTEEQKEMALRAYQERVSMRGITRIFGIARQTLTQWLKKEASVLPNGVETVAKAQPDDVLELDELWSFVQRRAIGVGCGLHCAGEPARLRPFLWETEERKAVGNCGSESPKPTRHVARTVISGTRIRRCSQVRGIKALAKRVERPPMWNVGTTPCVNDWLVL